MTILPDDAATANRTVTSKRPTNTTEGATDEGDGSKKGDESRQDGLSPEGVLGLKILVFFMFLSAVLALSALIATCVVRKRREVPACRGFGQVSVQE